MNISHKEIEEMYNFLPKEIREGIDSFFQQDLDNPEYEYSTDDLWIMDQSIGGVGGYYMPSNPTKNPFSSGEKRSLYRPLQYARSSIDMCDVRIFARTVIENTGMHLEAVCRKLIDERSSLIKKYFPKQTTLGKAVKIIEDRGFVDSQIIHQLYMFVKIYNLSKHEINQDESRDRMFNAKDAIVSYFTARVIGINLLKLIDCEEAFITYECISN